MIGQHILVLTRGLGQQSEGLCYKDVSGRVVVIKNSCEQSVNKHTLEFQTVPLVLFCDVIEQNDLQIIIPENALVSVLPVSSNAIEKIIKAGDIDAWVESLKLNLL